MRSGQSLTDRYISGTVVAILRLSGSNWPEAHDGGQRWCQKIRVLRLAAIAAFILGAILVAIGMYEYVKGGRPTSSISAGLGAMVIAVLCYQVSKCERVQQKDRPL